MQFIGSDCKFPFFNGEERWHDDLFAHSLRYNQHQQQCVMNRV